MPTQASLFPEPAPAPATKNCVRCAKRCRVVEKTNPNANYFVKGTKKTGKFCTECLVVDFFINFDLGPASALGKEYFDHSIPWPEWRKGQPEVRFDPESLRAPHVQEQIKQIVRVAAQQYGAELDPEEIDWDEVIANWHLPFPEEKQRRKRK